MRTKRVRGNSSGGRKAYVLMAKHAPMGFPYPFHCYHFFSYSLTKRCFHTRNSSIFRGLKTCKTHIFPCSSNAFLSKTCVWMVHFASFSFARLLPLCVFWSAFLPTFPPFSWHSTSPFPLKQHLFRSFPCNLMHLAQLFHAKSMAKCRI